MNENDRWGAHLEYFKLTIALATALIAGAAAIYVDTSKIPLDNSQFVLLAGVAVFLVTLISSVLGVAFLGNHLLHFVSSPATGTVPQDQRDAMDRRSRRVVRSANWSFGSLLVASAALGVFFGFRTVQATWTSFERAIATARIANQSLVNPVKGETADLKTIDLQGDKYQLVFQISPGPGTTTIITDATGEKLTSAHRQ